MGLFKKQVKPELYPSELEHLIDIVIEDGIITDKERCVLHKKATMLNIDPDELDMVLESRLRGRQVLKDESPTENLPEKVTIYLAENSDKLKKWFSDAQLSVKLGKVAKKLGSVILYPVLLLYNTYKSPNTSSKDKLIIIAPLAYFILPVDLLPDMVVGLGYADDGIALRAALKAIASSITPKIIEQTKSMHKDLIGEIDPKVAENVESEIDKK
jgi:uncharacterized membrane protein YkvA (DUF1232 family)